MNSAFREVWRSKTLWGVHVIANAALLAAIYGLLLIPDRTVLDLVYSGAAGLGILIFASWLHAGTFEYFRANHGAGEASLRASFKPSIRRVGLFAIWLLLLGAAILLVLQLRDHLDSLSQWMASAATLRLQTPVSPASVSAVLSALISFAAFAVVPFLMLQVWKWKWSRKYLLTYAAVFLAAAYFPYRLVWWVPGFGGLYTQTASMAVRFSLAYLLAVTGWLLLASTLGQARSAHQSEVHR